MAKLKCVKDNRRVMVLDTGTVLHRSDGTHCETDKVKIGENVYFIQDVQFYFPTSHSYDVVSTFGPGFAS